MIVLALLLAFLPSDHVVVDRVDVVEFNSFFNEDGKSVFNQFIWYDIETRFLPSGTHPTTDYVVRDWRLEKDAPAPVKRGDRYVQEWFDAKTKTARRVESRVYVEIGSTYDREMIHRDRVPECKRRKLTVRSN